MNRLQTFMARVRNSRGSAPAPVKVKDGEGPQISGPGPKRSEFDGPQLPPPGLTPTDANPYTRFDRPSALGLGRVGERQLSTRPFGVARDDSLF